MLLAMSRDFNEGIKNMGIIEERITESKQQIKMDELINNFNENEHENNLERMESDNKFS
eukprot:CAMPEP_0170562718 /NCGR_PEP_ID=MMETSP0211-20121228/62162_1 /TAXON_ID=311385 /ORGANISM="Pseudokeronopsis sp., Strain OXSARD2" /LENGTH=58 /DNA_ID=CAMNT_0010879989 /DNA_START=36 /DNA_END=212 /DNA_ORIENTATION=+